MAGGWGPSLGPLPQSHHIFSPLVATKGNAEPGLSSPHPWRIHCRTLDSPQPSWLSFTPKQGQGHVRQSEPLPAVRKKPTAALRHTPLLHLSPVPHPSPLLHSCAPSECSADQKANGSLGHSWDHRKGAVPARAGPGLCSPGPEGTVKTPQAATATARCPACSRFHTHAENPSLSVLHIRLKHTVMSEPTVTRQSPGASAC